MGYRLSTTTSAAQAPKLPSEIAGKTVEEVSFYTSFCQMTSITDILFDKYLQG